MSWLSALSRTRARFTDALASLFRPGSAPSAADLDDLLDLLVIADVPPRVAQELLDAARQALLDALPAAATPPDFATESAARPDRAPTVVLLVGINGSGKTTT
ncbi:MAG: hypothetical protein J6Y19_07370, partial [Kiritimatiellae bacterium]|nr:hypothetical protein [Kiritimatiellia bacterium]